MDSCNNAPMTRGFLICEVFGASGGWEESGGVADAKFRKENLDLTEEGHPYGGGLSNTSFSLTFRTCSITFSGTFNLRRYPPGFPVICA